MTSAAFPPGGIDRLLALNDGAYRAPGLEVIHFLLWYQRPFYIPIG